LQKNIQINHLVFFGNKRKHYIYIPNAKKTIPKNIISFSIHPILIISSSTTNIIKNVSNTITINNQYRREAQTKPTIPPMQMRITTPNHTNNKNSNNTKNKKITTIITTTTQKHQQQQ